MQQSSTTTFGWLEVHCNSTTAILIPVSGWMSAPNVHYLRCSFELVALLGNLQLQAAFQTANNLRSPDTAAGFGSTVSSVGYEDPTDL